jgi:thiol-disulfide isomerase/thioredoxin
MKRLLFIAALCLTTTLLSLSGCSKQQSGTSAQKKGVVESKPAPDVTLKSISGESLTLSSLKGKVVLLNFWATWCPPCREEIPSMMKLNSFMAGKPFQMLAVSIDEGGKKAVEDFFAESRFSLPAYLDPETAAAKVYGITGVPETFVIDKQGIVVKKVIGPMDWNSPEAVAFLEGLMTK